MALGIYDEDARMDLNAKIESLIKNNTQYTILVSGLINTATLAYDGETLHFNNDFIASFMLATVRPLYDARVKELQEERGRVCQEN